MLIDTHMHIFDKKYSSVDDLIKRATENKIEKMIAVGYDYETSLKAVELASKYPFIYASIGVHPNSAFSCENLSWLEKMAQNPKIIAIGEIGLDYYWNKTVKENQKELFIKQIEIAQKVNLPIIIHCRDAIEDCYQILKNYNLKGVLHCYSSSFEMAQQFIKLGYYLGIGGVVTFKNSIEIKRVVRKVDLKYLLSETDSPYLAPHPFRGQINEPSYLKYVIEAIAEIKNLSLDEVTNKLAENTKNLFGI